MHPRRARNRIESIALPGRTVDFLSGSVFPGSWLEYLRSRITMSDRSYLRFNPLHSAPNLLTLMRICLAPFLVSAILDNRFALSFGLFVAAGLTYALDGTFNR
jgi:hypothetical protein